MCTEWISRGAVQDRLPLLHTIDVLPRPLPKSTPDIIGPETNRFSQQHLLLGSVMHSIIMGNSISDMPFIKFLQNTTDFAPQLLQQLAAVAESTKKEIEKAVGVPYEEITWVNELRAMTTPNQNKIILLLSKQKSALYKKMAARENGYLNIPEMVRSLLIDRGKKASIGGKEYSQQELQLEAQRIMAKNTQEVLPFVIEDQEEDDLLLNERKFKKRLEQKTPDELLILYVNALLSYSYLSFFGSNTELFNDRKLGLLTARIDQVGFFPLKNKESNNQIIARAKTALKHNLNNKSMLAEEDIAHIGMLFSAIQSGEIAFIFHEIKTETVAQTTHTTKEIVTHTYESGLKEGYLTDVAHSLAALYFATQNTFCNPHNHGDQPPGFIQLMSDDVEERLMGMKSILTYFKSFFSDPSKMLITRIHLPIIDHEVLPGIEEKDIHRYTINGDRVKAGSPMIIHTTKLNPLETLKRTRDRIYDTLLEEEQLRKSGAIAKKTSIH